MYSCISHREIKIQTGSSRIWTWVIDFISNDKNRYAERTSSVYVCI